MLDLGIYDFLEKTVKSQEGELLRFQELCECDNNTVKLGINSLQSIVRSSVIEEQQDDPAYSRVIYRKGEYESIKFGNIKFDMLNIVSLLSNLQGVIEKEKWAIIMSVVLIVCELRKVKVKLSPEMGIIVLALYKNGYQKRKDSMIEEDKLKNLVKDEFVSSLKKVAYEDFDDEFASAISGLYELKIIDLSNGKVALIEEVTI